MKLSRKIMALLLAGVLLLAGFGCSQKSSKTLNGSEGTPGTATIVTSFYPMYILTLNVAKDIPGVRVVNLTPPQSGCLHNYQLTPDDMKTLEQAEFFVVNGAGMESFMDQVAGQLDSPQVVEASRGMTLINNEGEEEENPHLWVGVSGAIQQVQNIGQQLAALDPGNAGKYRANTEAYVKRLETLKNEMHGGLKEIQMRDIVTFHEAFPYFAKEFNLNIVAVIEREPGSQPSAGELADTVEIVRQAKVKALFAEPQYPAKAAETIAGETGAKVHTLDPVVSGPMEPEAYEKIMRNNLRVLQEALQ